MAEKDRGQRRFTDTNRYAGAKDHNGCKLAAGVQNARNVMSQVGHTQPSGIESLQPSSSDSRPD